MMMKRNWIKSKKVNLTQVESIQQGAKAKAALSPDLKKAIDPTEVFSWIGKPPNEWNRS